ncbi:hypothetical protein Hanom_Chr07g00610431 [Helianthus anomalus]
MWSLLSPILTMREEMMITQRMSGPSFVPFIRNRCCKNLNEVIVPSGDHSYGCPDYEAGYSASYGQEDYGNNFFVSGASCVQRGVGEPSYTQRATRLA